MEPAQLFERMKELRKLSSKASESAAEALLEQRSKAGDWAKLFQQFFLQEHHSSDDLIFYVTTHQAKTAAASTDPSQQHEKILVYRRGATSKPLPQITDKGISWEESVCLNAILQVIKYQLVVALCTTNDAGKLKPVDYIVRDLYATPSYRSMNAKGSAEIISYPEIFFTVDDFDELFERITVTPKHTFTLELVASAGSKEAILFNGSLTGEGLMRSYLLHERDRSRRNFWVNPRAEHLVFFTITAPEKESGFVEMATAVVDGTRPKPPSPAASSVSSAAATPGVAGLVSNLWHSAPMQSASSLMQKASKSVVRGLGFPDSPKTLQGASFNCFVTYLCLRWDDILHLIFVRGKPPKLVTMQRNAGRRLGARADQVAFDKNGKPMRGPDNFGRKVVESTKTEIRQNLEERRASMDAGVGMGGAGSGGEAAAAAAAAAAQTEASRSSESTPTTPADDALSPRAPPAAAAAAAAAEPSEADFAPPSPIARAASVDETAPSPQLTPAPVNVHGIFERRRPEAGDEEEAATSDLA